MCGIAGFIDTKTSKEVSINRLNKMLQSIEHRGPDDSGVFSDGPIYLGHNRLAIIDLSKHGHQPKISTSGRYVCSFNGEIYNYKILKVELEKKGYSFLSNSDTEVLLTLIEEYGFNKAIKKCIGMFAIALWDKKKNEVKLARDRYGEKPLYYGWHDGIFLFGSELKALVAHSSFSKEICNEALGIYFKYNYIKAPYSIYKNTYKLEPGKILTLNLSCGLVPKGEEISSYWSIDEISAKGIRDPYKGNFRDASIELESILADAVGMQMQSDVPLGALLSGGVDSSLIVSLMQNASGKNINTFSIGFKDKEFNEANYSKAIASHLGTNHEELYLDNKYISETALSMSSIYDEPFGDASQVPTYLVSKLAKQRVTVSLSGDGGDEIFCGYSKYLLGQNLSKIPFRNFLGYVLKVVPKKFTQIVLSHLRGKKEFDESSMEFLISLLDCKTYIELSDTLSLDRKASEYFKNDTKNKLILDSPYSEINNNILQSMMYIDRKGYLPDDILVKVDRASMAVSLENRVPFLDHRIVEFASSLPLGFINGQGIQKRILKDILYRHVPKALVDRPKSGFSPPIAQWLRSDLKEWSESLLNQSQNASIDIVSARHLYEEHLTGFRDNSILLWKILMFLDWERKWI